MEEDSPRVCEASAEEGHRVIRWPSNFFHVPSSFFRNLETWEFPVRKKMERGKKLERNVEHKIPGQLLLTTIIPSFHLL